MSKKNIRKTLFDHFKLDNEKNLYCNLKNLTNEASVESFFINRMLSDMKYNDINIKTKESIDELPIPKGSKTINYKPDYCIIINKKPKLIIDAKSPKKNIYDYTDNCAGYCLYINRRDPKKPLKYFLLLNGLKTTLFEWDNEEPLVELNFSDFQIGNERYEKLRSIISFENLKRGKIDKSLEQFIKLKKIDKEDAEKLFIQCHKYIWKTEKRGPYSAFKEFVKIIFLKLWHDRLLHEEYKSQNIDVLSVPRSVLTFSIRWIESRENDVPNHNPISELQFKKLMQVIENDIVRKNKKRIFDVDETIDLNPQTIKGIVEKLENVDLFGIDEDLNGRLFETFLKATMRGKDLGQYFTPRSIVLLATKLAGISANDEHIDRVLDACCGTGGFLIEALGEMRNQIRNNQSYSMNKKTELIETLSNEYLYGIDAAKDPKLARIARINMYLHGDGGSHIYECDGLDNEIEIDKSNPSELQREIEDLKENLNKILKEDKGFNVVLTNPPFSMSYEIKNKGEARILKQYDLAKEDESSSKLRGRLRSMDMFTERYYKLLKPGGKLLTIVDETLLSSSKFSYVRKFIRDNFIIKANISLHGDAFRRSGSRAKTALLYLEKKKTLSDKQPSAFYYPSMYLGVDDLPVTSSKQKILEAREKANQEIQLICEEFNKFIRGKSTEYAVSPECLVGRLDLKHLVTKRGRFIKKWKDDGYDVIKLSDVAKPIENTINPNDAINLNKDFRILTISYEGRVRADEIRKGKNINYSEMKVAQEGDLIFSGYNSIHGAIGYVTKEFDGVLASGSYTIVQCETEYDALYLWSIFRTTEIRIEMLADAIGVGRQTINWDDIKDIKVPWIDKVERKRIYKQIIDAWEAEKFVENTFKNLKLELNSKFNVESNDAKEWFIKIKPPK